MQQVHQTLPHTEGESNTSQARAAWRAGRDADATRELIERDSRVFMHQSLSTPVLSAIAKAEGIWIEDTNGRRFMDFHGNSVHHMPAPKDRNDHLESVSNVLARNSS